MFARRAHARTPLTRPLASPSFPNPPHTERLPEAQRLPILPDELLFAGTIIAGSKAARLSSGTRRQNLTHTPHTSTHTHPTQLNMQQTQELLDNDKIAQYERNTQNVMNKMGEFVEVRDFVCVCVCVCQRAAQRDAAPVRSQTTLADAPLYHTTQHNT